jgi:hypothetical protein
MKFKLFLITTLLLSSALNAQQRTLSQVIIDHLSYLGYKTERIENKIAANHHIKPGFDIIVIKNGVLFRAWFQHKNLNATQLAKFILLVNRLNENTTVARFYVDSEQDLIIEGWYALPYSKKSFSNFITTWEYDFAQVLQQNSEALQEFIM